MPAPPKGARRVAVGALLLQCAASCTLTGGSYEPSEAAAPLQPASTAPADAGAVVPNGMPLAPSAPPTASCASGNEAAGCEIELIPGTCSSNTDCESRHCREGQCQRATCDDGRQNQDEAGVDCGGSGCPRCAEGASCAANADCSTGVCSEAGCAPGVARCCKPASCDDGIANGTEPVVDCGDERCGPCPDASPCTADAQCASQSCQQGRCQPRPCADGMLGGSETDIDCGGNDAECARCGAGDACAADSDCVSADCSGGRCSSCGDGERNGTESGVDCGGECGPCPPGADCRIDADCQSAACQDGRCCGGTRVDCTRCARRLARTLSCSSNGPNGAAQCDAFLDCLANNTDVCPVRYAPGCTDDPGGVCNHNAFGGNGGPAVALADAILGTASCTFGDE